MTKVVTMANTAFAMQREVLDSNRTVFIHDLDGVHHRYDGLPDLYDFYARMKFLTLSQHFEDLSFEDIKGYGLKSFEQTGDGLLLFCELARSRGMDAERVALFRETIFREFHRVGLETLRKEAPDVFEQCELTLKLFEDLKPHVRHGLLTQSCGENWGKPILHAQGKLQYFDPSALMDFATSSFNTKAQSTKPLEMILNTMHAVPEQCVFIEDSLRNLERAKQLDRRILTAYICHDVPMATIPDYVDIQVRGLKELLFKTRSVYLKIEPHQNMALRK